MFYLLKQLLLLNLVIFKLKCNNLIFNEIMILNASFVCLLHSCFIKDHPIWILEDGSLISKVVLSHFKIFGLKTLKELYATDLDFKDAYENCRDGRTCQKFVIHDGLLYRASKLCVPPSSVQLMLLQEAHGGGLMGHFGVKKTERRAGCALFLATIAV
jgi:hypothetical protein